MLLLVVLVDNVWTSVHLLVGERRLVAVQTRVGGAAAEGGEAGHRVGGPPGVDAGHRVPAPLRRAQVLGHRRGHCGRAAAVRQVGLLEQLLGGHLLGLLLLAAESWARHVKAVRTRGSRSGGGIDAALRGVGGVGATMFTACGVQHLAGEAVKGGVEGVGGEARVAVDPTHPPTGVSRHTRCSRHTGWGDFLGAEPKAPWPVEPDLAHHLPHLGSPAPLLVDIPLVLREVQVCYISSRSSDLEHLADSGLPVNKGRRTTGLPARQGSRSTIFKIHFNSNSQKVRGRLDVSEILYLQL